MPQTPSDMIDQFIAKLPDWRGDLIARLRSIINKADSNLVEDWKYGIPVWRSNGNVVALGAFKDHVKINFFNGAKLPDPHRLFNGGLDAKKSRSIDMAKGDRVDSKTLTALVRAAVAHNSATTTAGAIPRSGQSGLRGRTLTSARSKGQGAILDRG
jgi:hypothetical protein